MHIIDQYIDHLRLGQLDEEVSEGVKNKLREDMHASYQEKVSRGYTESEALGLVIEQYSPEALKKNERSGERVASENTSHNHVNQQRNQTTNWLDSSKVDAFLESSRRSSRYIGVGVMLILLGVSTMIFYMTILNQFEPVFGLIPLFFSLAIAVGLFIYAGLTFDQVKNDVYAGVLATEEIERLIIMKKEMFKPYVMKVISAVILCILAPLLLILITVVNNDWATIAVSIMLVILAIAVYVLIVAIKPKEDLEALIKLSKRKKARDEAENIGNTPSDFDNKMDAFHGVIWPLAVIIFLVTGFVFNLWYINWLIFPVSGLIAAIFANSYRLFKE